MQEGDDRKLSVSAVFACGGLASCISIQPSPNSVEMSDRPNSLFRPEALSFRRERLQGTVSIATPLSWQIIGFLLLGALASAIIFLATGTYARIETASGAIALDRGVASIVASRPGTIRTLDVRDGQHVRTGQNLLDIRAEESMPGGDTAPERITAALHQQDLRLETQASMTLRAAEAEEARLRAQGEGAADELAKLDAQVADQRRLLEAAERDFEGVGRIAARGFISRRDLDARQAEMLSRRQQLAQLEQQRAAKRAEVTIARRAASQAILSAGAQMASTQSSRAQLQQQIAQADLARGYSLVAPVDGLVTALTARIGQPVSAEQPVMVILPTGSRPTAELYVPTTAAGFLRVGQEVRLAIDAFPYESFGTLTAAIDEISSATSVKQGTNGSAPVYLVRASLKRPWVDAFGSRQPLVPGMTLSARIITERRTLLEWLFEPIFAVRRR